MSVLYEAPILPQGPVTLGSGKLFITQRYQSLRLSLLSESSAIFLLPSLPFSLFSMPNSSSVSDSRFYQRWLAAAPDRQAKIDALVQQPLDSADLEALLAVEREHGALPATRG